MNFLILKVFWYVKVVFEPASIKLTDFMLEYKYIDMILCVGAFINIQNSILVMLM